MHVTRVARQVFKSKKDRSAAQLPFMDAFGLPAEGHSLELIFMKLVYAAHLLREAFSAKTLLQFVELFAGEAGIGSRVKSQGFLAAALDICISSQHDILTPQGFKLHVMVACCTVSSAKAWSGIVCSSWIWIGRRNTGRSAARPLGHQWRANVKRGNALMLRQVG